MSDAGRYHSLDALRATALLLGIALHATMSFLPGFRAAGWPIVDASQSTTLAWLYFCVHIFRMSLFFLIAGFFARLLLARLGVRGFCRHRLRRIGLPLAVAMLLVMPLTIVPLVIAVQLQPGAVSGAYAALRPQGGIPWGHLWFLYQLLVLSGLLLAGRAAVLAADRAGMLRRGIDRAMHWLVAMRLLPVAAAAPLALTLYATPAWQAWDGIPAPIIGFIPDFPAVLAFGSAMSVGWLLHRRQALLGLLARDWPLYLSIAAASSVAAGALIGSGAQLRVVDMQAGTRLAYAASYTLAVWSWCLGLAGIAVSRQSRPSAGWRYLADASYWMYLTHVPLVWMLQVWAMRWAVPWQVKYPLILAVTVGVLLLLYHWLVRGTWVGWLLNGRRLPARAGDGVLRGAGPA